MGLAAAALAALLSAGPMTPSLIHGASGAAVFGKDGRVEIEQTVDRLGQAHVSTYLYEIYRDHAETEWKDLPAFLDAAARRGIKVMVLIFPPGESGTNYRPFGFDYPLWAARVAELSLTHPALKGFTIDDFSENFHTFPPAYADRMVRAAREQNPRFQFWPICYYRDIVGNGAVMREYDPAIIDGVIFPFRDEPDYDTSVSMTAAAQILHVRQALGLNEHLAVMVYARHYTHQTNKGNPGPDYVGEVTRDALALGDAGFDDGTIIYDLNLTGQDQKYASAADYKLIKDIYGDVQPTSRVVTAS